MMLGHIVVNQTGSSIGLPGCCDHSYLAVSDQDRFSVSLSSPTVIIPIVAVLAAMKASRCLKGYLTMLPQELQITFQWDFGLKWAPFRKPAYILRAGQSSGKIRVG